MKDTWADVPSAATTSASRKTATTEAAGSTKATESATSKIQSYALLGSNFKKANSTSNCAIKATSKADVGYANTERSAADAEHEQNSTLATSSNLTQLATTYPKFYERTPNILRNSEKALWEKNSKLYPYSFLLVLLQANIRQ